MLRSSFIFFLSFYTLMNKTGDTIVSLKERAAAYANAEQFEEAIHLYSQCYATDINDVHSIFQTALCLLKIGRITDSIELFESLIPRVAHPLPLEYNIAYAYKAAGMLDTAIARYKKIIAADPEYEDAHMGLAFAYIQKGDFVHGWPEHRRYLKRSGKDGESLRTLLAKNDLIGKKVLLHYEGGLGDTLLFIRYAERLKKMGAHIICMVQTPLIPLLSRCTYIDTLLPYEHPHPQHDAKASLMSLPAIFEDTSDTFPARVPYLYADPERVAYWQMRVAQQSGIKIGITWQSDVHNDVSRLPIARRGIPLSLFEPLLQNSRYTFFSLQKFEGSEQIVVLSPQARLIVYPELDTTQGAFMDTAALIQNMDLIIAVDSAVANIAGGLGIPTLLLLPYVTDWRWIAGRTDSPWYPRHTLIKQQKPFDWNSVIEIVTHSLESLFLKKG